MNARFFDMLHHARDKNIGRIRNHIDIDFDCVLQIMINQDRVATRNMHRFLHIAAQGIHIMRNFHRPTAQHIGRPHDDRIADAFCDAFGLFHIARHAIIRLF